MRFWLIQFVANFDPDGCRCAKGSSTTPSATCRNCCLSQWPLKFTNLGLRRQNVIFSVLSRKNKGGRPDHKNLKISSSFHPHQKKYHFRLKNLKFRFLGFRGGVCLKGTCVQGWATLSTHTRNRTKRRGEWHGRDGTEQTANKGRNRF